VVQEGSQVVVVQEGSQVVVVQEGSQVVVQEGSQLGVQEGNQLGVQEGSQLGVQGSQAEVEPLLPGRCSSVGVRGRAGQFHLVGVSSPCWKPPTTWP